MWLPLTVTIITVYVIDLELIRQRAGGRKKKKRGGLWQRVLAVSKRSTPPQFRSVWILCIGWLLRFHYNGTKSKVPPIFFCLIILSWASVACVSHDCACANTASGRVPLRESWFIDMLLWIIYCTLFVSRFQDKLMSSLSPSSNIPPESLAQTHKHIWNVKKKNLKKSGKWSAGITYYDMHECKHWDSPVSYSRLEYGFACFTHSQEFSSSFFCLQGFTQFRFFFFSQFPDHAVEHKQWIRHLLMISWPVFALICSSDMNGR